MDAIIIGSGDVFRGWMRYEYKAQGRKKDEYHKSMWVSQSLGSKEIEKKKYRTWVGEKGRITRAVFI